MKEMSQQFQLRKTSEVIRSDEDWRLQVTTYIAPLGTVTQRLGVAKFGGQAPIYVGIRINFVNPVNNQSVIKFLREYMSLGSGTTLPDTVNAQALRSCTETVQKLKAPQVKTMLWRKEPGEGGNLLKVYCGVDARTEYVVLERKALSSDFWTTSLGRMVF